MVQKTIQQLYDSDQVDEQYGAYVSQLRKEYFDKKDVALETAV